MDGPDYSGVPLDIEPHGGTAVIFKNELTGEWFLRLKGGNGEILCTTEGHKNKDDVRELHDKYFIGFELESTDA